MNRSSARNNGRHSAYRSEYQPRYGTTGSNSDRDADHGYQGVNYGRNHQDENERNAIGSYQNQQNPQYGAHGAQNANTFNQNPDLNRNYGSSQYGNQSIGHFGGQWSGSNQYGNTDQYGRADRFGGAENFADRGYSQQTGGWSQDRARHEGNFQHHGQSYGSQNYPSTERFGALDQQSQWAGHPARNSDYGWNGEQESHAGKGPKNYRRSDERIQEEVSEALTHAHHIDASEIEVKVSEGIVTLDGSVSERRMKRAAEEAIEHLSGVKDVKNNLNVSSSGSTASGLSTESSTTSKKASSKLQ